MKCNCHECGGDGTIACPECDGRGVYVGNIENISLSASMNGYEELVELQKDARRVTRQAERLKELNPARSASYDAQLKATLFVINGLADSVYDSDKP